MTDLAASITLTDEEMISDLRAVGVTPELVLLAAVCDWKVFAFTVDPLDAFIRWGQTWSLVTAEAFTDDHGDRHWTIRKAVTQ